MIKSSKGITRIVGRKEEVATDLALIFGTLIEQINEDETKKMIKYSYEAIKEYSESKIKKETDKEIKEIIKRELPEDLAKILLEII